MIGAVMIMLSAISTNIWICWTSLVLRVIRLAAPNWLTSTWLNVWTLRKIALRTSRPNAIAVRAPKNTPMTAAMLSAKVTISMNPPVRRM